MIYSGLHPGSDCQSDDPVFCSRGSASTPVENIGIIEYFEKRSDLIRKKPVNLAVLQCPPFWVRDIGGSVRMEAQVAVEEIMLEILPFCQQ